jgi:hypothetical protein
MKPWIFLSVLALASVSAHAQFKVIKAAPFPPATARQKIRTLLANATPENRDQTVATISEWLDWYRDILDEELIARWKSPDRANLPLVMTALGDARVAREIVEYSWHTDRSGTFVLANAPMLGDLMERYPASAKPFLDDLLPAPVNLTQPEAETVCRILLDMPDIGTWKQSAQQILPRYRAVADQLLKQDLNAADQEKVYRATRWRSVLGLDPPPTLSSTQKPPKRAVLQARSQTQVSDIPGERPHLIGPGATKLAGYTGPMSGTFDWTGDPIPQNGECAFPNIPPVKLLLDFDTKHWEARLEPGDGNTQVLVMRNKGKGTQKKCVVKWSVME